MKTIVLMDGGNTRALVYEAGYHYGPDAIEKIAHACVDTSESLIRILYYDCAPFNGTVSLPVSGREREFSKSDEWLHQLSHRELFAVRLGVLKFRGFKPRRIPINHAQLRDSDFKPMFEQKGVDMRIGLDIALYSKDRLVDRIVLVSQDTDCIPAMKLARKSGLQVVLVRLPNSIIAPELLAHADFERKVQWPDLPQHIPTNNGQNEIQIPEVIQEQEPV